MFSFSRPQHGLHGVVVGFVPLLWLAKMITLQSVLLLLKTVVRTALIVLQPTITMPLGEDMLFIRIQGNLNLYLQKSN